MANEHSVPIGVAYDDAAHLHIHQSPEEPQHEIMESVEKPIDEERPEESLSPNPNTAAVEPDELSEDSTPPVPPVPRQLSSRASRSRIRRGHPKQYDSDPQMYGQDLLRMTSSRSNRPHFEDEMYESDPHYGSDRAWREEIRHPDYQDRRHIGRGKPPRAFLNGGNPGVGTKQWVEDSRSYQDPFSPLQPPKRFYTFDEEQGYGSSIHGGMGNRQTFSTDDPARLQWNALTKEQKAEVLRLPWLQWMNSDFKNHFVASMGEFVGTTMFLFFAFAGTEVANIASDANGSNNSSDSNTTTGASTGFNVNVLMYIALSFGFSLMVNVWIFFRISGGLFNPAVTLALMLIRAISVVRAIALCISQILGGIMASVLVRFLFPENFNVRTTLGGGASLAQGIFIEALLTAELIFTIYMLAAEKHRATFMAPIGIGLALFIAELVGVQFTGGSLNPARSFGPCVVTATFDEEHWIYWVGPFLGAIIAWAFYRFIKSLEYEMVNPGADGDPLNDPTKNPEKAAEIKIARSKTSLSSIKTPPA